MSDVTKIKLPDNSELNIKDYRIPGVDSTPTSGSNNVVTSGGMHTAMADTELVVATALNDLNDRVSDLEDGAETLESDSVWEAGTGTNSVIVKDSLGNAGGNYSTVEGKGSVTGGTHTEYDLTPDTSDSSAGSYAHAEGRYTIACGKNGAHAEGDRTLASGSQSHAEGASTVASGQYSHAEGGQTKATAGGTHAEGVQTIASGSYSHAENQQTKASGTASHAEGNNTSAEGVYAHAEGWRTRAIGNVAHTEGQKSTAIGLNSHAEGNSVSYGQMSHSEGGSKGIDVFPVGAAGATTYTSALDSAEWNPVRNQVGDTIFCNVLKNSVILKKNDDTSFPIRVTGASLNGENITFTVEETLSANTALNGSVNYWINFSVAYGDLSHSENEGNVSYGVDSHAEGHYNFAVGNESHVEGKNVVAQNATEHAEGSFNVSNKASDTYGNAGNTQHSIGIGNSTTRKNAVEVMQNGDAYLYGVGSYDGTNYSSATTIQDVINGKQEALVSGTNLKTINNESLLGSGNISISGGSGGISEKTYAIPFGSVDSTSTSTVLTATVNSFPATLSDGVCAYIYNGVVSSESGCTLNINNTGAKPIYSTMELATAVTTTFSTNYTMLFIYNSTRVSGGCWDMFYGYYTSTQYRMRTGNTTRPVAGAVYRYRLLFSSADGTKWVPANNSTSTNATGSRTVNQTPINPFGPIVYYSNTTAISDGNSPSVSYQFEQYNITLGYSFNRTGAALTLTNKAPVYIKCAPQSDGSAIIDADTPYVQTLPSTADGKIYIYLGHATSATQIELVLTHPVYYYENGAIRLWTNALSSSGTANDSTITIQMNGATVDSFTTNASSNKTINLGTVITDVSGKQDTIVNNGVLVGVNSGGIRAIKTTNNKIYALNSLVTTIEDDNVLATLGDIPTISTNIASDKANNNKVSGTKATYDAIHPAVVSTQPAGGMLPNILYDLGTVTGTVTFTMASPTDATIINHYYWTFETSSTAPTITWPAGITSWYGGSAPTISASKHYEISVLDGVGCIMEV